MAGWGCIRSTSNARRNPRRLVGVVSAGLLEAMCGVHGGAARQVAAKREQRVLLAEARAATPTVIMQEPEEILLTALHDTNAAGLDGGAGFTPAGRG